MLELSCENCPAGNESVFNCLTADQRKILHSNYQQKKIKQGEIIFKEGDIPYGLISLSRGKVKVFKEGVGGRDQIVRLARPVGFIGYRALFANEPHTSTAMALEDSIICIFDKNSLFEVMKRNSDLSFSIIKSLATELGFTFKRTVTLTQKHIRGRLAEALLFLIETYGYENDRKTINAYLSREDIANLSSMTTSNAIRTLSSFAGENILSLSGRKITIEDIDQLEQISAKG